MEGNIPWILWDLGVEALHLPTDTDQPRSCFAQKAKGAVVMALAAAQPGSARIDADERNEHEIRFNERRTTLRLHDPEGAGLERVSSAEAEWLCGVGEAGECHDSADGAGFFHRQQGADLASQGMVAGNDGRVRQKRRQMLGELLLQDLAIRIVEGANVGLTGCECGLAK
jgi:hypothetical protein